MTNPTRRVCKLTLYLCTTCLAPFQKSKDAKAHAKTHPAPARAPAPRKPRGPTQVGRVLEAIRRGCKSAESIHKRTGIPLERVHSLLAYHRRRGVIKGFTGKLRVST